MTGILVFWFFIFYVNPGYSCFFFLFSWRTKAEKARLARHNAEVLKGLFPGLSIVLSSWDFAHVFHLLGIYKMSKLIKFQVYKNDLCEILFFRKKNMKKYLFTFESASVARVR